MIVLPVKVITQPTEEPLSVDEVKHWMRLDFDFDEEDPDPDPFYQKEISLLNTLIKTAREYAELTLCQRAFAEQTLEYSTNEFKKTIKLPRPPLQSVTAFTYKDSGGTTHTLIENTDYLVDNSVEPAILIPVASWPSVKLHPIAPIKIQYVAGYTSQTMPQEIKQWICLMVAHWYENREAILPMGHNIMKTPYGVDTILQGYRTFGAGDD